MCACGSFVRTQTGESEAAYSARLHNLFNPPSPSSDPQPTPAGASSGGGSGMHLAAATTPPRGDGGGRASPPSGHAAVPSTAPHPSASTAAANLGAARSGGAAAPPPPPLSPPPLAAAADAHVQPATTAQGPKRAACAICWSEPIEFGFAVRALACLLALSSHLHQLGMPH